jgi:hypothetical protein
MDHPKWGRCSSTHAWCFGLQWWISYQRMTGILHALPHKHETWTSKKKWETRVKQPITDHLFVTKHFGRSFSILLHFEWFKMLLEHLLKLYKSSLKCKLKGPVKNEGKKKKPFFSNCKMQFFSFWPLLLSKLITFLVLIHLKRFKML